MQGYRSLTMVETPWGDAAELRTRKLRPGRGTPREEAERNQRERLFAAMVATVAERGYEATTVADLEKLAGVSRSAFYRYFGDKQECFIATIEALAGPSLETVKAGLEHPGDTEAAKRAFEALFQQIVAQPAAAKMCFVDVYAAGPRAWPWSTARSTRSRCSPNRCSTRRPAMRECLRRSCGR